MKLEILGTGCAKCRALEGVARSAADKANIEYEISKVTDIMEITKRGVMITPALTIDGEVVCAGTIPSEAQVETMLKQRATD